MQVLSRLSPATDSTSPNRFLSARRAIFSSLAIVFFTALITSCNTFSDTRRTGPWNLQALSKTPVVNWGPTNGLLQELFYEGEPFEGKPTRVFAYLGRPPARSAEKLPGIVLVHGGGGTAFKEWAEHWAAKGYVALAMDLSGNSPNGRLPDGAPDQADAVKFHNFTEAQAREMWTYHAVAAVVKGDSLLRSLPDLNPERIGITGISWGGYLTCIVAGIDPRLKVAVPVYGCGFLGDNSVWKDGSLAQMTPESRARWLRLFDPSQYLGNVRRPILFVNGTADFAYPLDSYQKSYRLVPVKWRHVSVAVNRPHGHFWTFPEVDAFVDSVLMGTAPLVDVGAPVIVRGNLSAKLDRAITAKESSLCYTTNSGPWQKRTWQTVPAQITGRNISATLPASRPLVAYLSITDEHGAVVSSEHVELPPD